MYKMNKLAVWPLQYVIVTVHVTYFEGSAGTQALTHCVHVYN